MSDDHRKMVKRLPCLVCGKNGPSDPHHLKRALPTNERGASRKAADRYLIPLCRDPLNDHGNGCHEKAEGTDDEAWLAENGIDGRAIAGALWRATGELDAMLRIVERSLLTRGKPIGVAHV
jgi:hypothetical protein